MGQKSLGARPTSEYRQYWSPPDTPGLRLSLRAGTFLQLSWNCSLSVLAWLFLLSLHLVDMVILALVLVLLRAWGMSGHYVPVPHYNTDCLCNTPSCTLWVPSVPSFIPWLIGENILGFFSLTLALSASMNALAILRASPEDRGWCLLIHCCLLSSRSPINCSNTITSITLFKDHILGFSHFCVKVCNNMHGCFSSFSSFACNALLIPPSYTV